MTSSWPTTSRPGDEAPVVRSTGPRADAWWRWIKREVPMKRFGQPREIGDAAAYLLSERASFINGAVLAVDGGQTR